jgi:hypothetical protein
MKLRWSQPPDDAPGSARQTESEMGRLVKGSNPTPSGEHSLGCPALTAAGTDRRSFQAFSDLTHKKSRQRSYQNPTPLLRRNQKEQRHHQQKA